MMKTWNIRHTVVVLYIFFYSIALLSHCFFSVNMDVFDCCARVSCSISCMKRQSKNTALKLKEVHSHLLACFTYSTARVASLSTQKRILIEWCLAPYLWSFTERVTRDRLTTCANMQLDRSFLFTVITGILSKSLILMFGNISIQNRDSSISKK